MSALLSTTEASMNPPSVALILLSVIWHFLFPFQSSPSPKPKFLGVSRRVASFSCSCPLGDQMMEMIIKKRKQHCLADAPLASLAAVLKQSLSKHKQKKIAKNIRDARKDCQIDRRNKY